MQRTNVTLIHSEDQKLARSLHELASLIKVKLKEADEAAEVAMRPYWAAIGDFLVEARDQFTRPSEFYAWANRQFDFSERQTKRYESCAKNIALHKRAARPTLSDAIRAAGQSPRGAPRGGHR